MRGIVDLVVHDTNLGERHFFVKKLSEPLDIIGNKNSRFAYFEPTKGKLTHHFGGKMNSFLADSRENTPPSAHMNTAVNSHGIGFAKLSCLSISMVVLSDEKMHQIP